MRVVVDVDTIEYLNDGSGLVVLMLHVAQRPEAVISGGRSIPNPRCLLFGMRLPSLTQHGLHNMERRRLMRREAQQNHVGHTAVRASGCGRFALCGAAALLCRRLISTTTTVVVIGCCVLRRQLGMQSGRSTRAWRMLVADWQHEANSVLTVTGAAGRYRRRGSQSHPLL